MNSCEMDRDPVLRARKIRILASGVLLSFFSNMTKVAIPGAVFDELQVDLGLNAIQIALIGSCFMYAYAASQLAVGIFSDRYGGVRLLLGGGALFCIGSLFFPVFSSVSALCAARIVTAFGAGVIFLGYAKLIADLFPERFAFVLGCVLLFGYFGPVAGVSLLVWLVKAVGWRPALALPAIISTLIFTMIALQSRGTIKPVTPGQTFRPVLVVMRSRPTVCLFLSSALIFGSYYAILSLLGRKCLEDFAHLTPLAAAGWITAMTILVAANNVLANLILKLFHDRRRVMLFFSAFCSLAGALLGLMTFLAHWPGWWLVPAFLLIAFPAGFFSIFGVIVKELNPPEMVGLSVSLLNFWAFVAIAATGHFAGMILHAFEDRAVHTADAVIYSAASYAMIFVLLSVLAAISMLTAFFVPETHKPTPEKNI